MIGLAINHESASHPGPVRAGSYGFAGAQRHEVTLMAGNSIVNNFQSPHGVAYGLEYRRRVTPFIDATVTLLDQGDTHVVKRKGVAGEGWRTREFLDHRAAVG